ncbi:MAG: hypothetical protein ACR2QW_06050, partial [bacterium]
SCAVACPYEGTIEPQAVAEVTRLLLDIGCYEISLGDTIGAGRPQSIGAMLDAVIEVTEPNKLAGHFHDTGDHALENIEVSLGKGIRTFDSAIGGLGGCPYAPGAKGNVSTLKVVDLLHQAGFETGVDIGALRKIETFVSEILTTAKHDTTQKPN